MLIMVVYALICAIGGLALHRFVGIAPAAALLSGVAALLTISGLRAGLAQSRINALHRAKLLKTEEEQHVLSSRLDEIGDEIEALQQRMTKKLDLLKEVKGLEQQVHRLQTKKTPRRGDENLSGELHAALRDGRVELYLQPIVTLPQRRVKFYEGFTRLRRPDGEIIMPDMFLDAAERAGLTNVIDTVLLFRCVEIARRLGEHDRRVGLFCNIAASTLEDEAVFPQFLQHIGGDPDLAQSLIFEMSMAEFAARSETARNHMSRLGGMGFRFSIDRAEHLAVDLPRLQAAGIRFVKIEAKRLLQSLQADGERPYSFIAGTLDAEDVHPVFRRHGIDLIAEKTEDEKSVIELLELGVQFGQGHVFGAPRPCKESLLAQARPATDFMSLAAA